MIITTKLQTDIYDALKRNGIPFYYRETCPRGEEIALLFDQPDRSRPNRYYPTFVVTDDEGKRVVIQQKGRFITADRQKLILLKQQHPEIEFRIVFTRSKTRISTMSTTTYAAWCERYSFQYCDSVPSKAWISELQGRTVGQVAGWRTPPDPAGVVVRS